jgi:hypothetical protein
MANLIANGSFVGHADGWFRDAGPAPAWTEGQLSVTPTGSNQIAYRPGGRGAIPLGATDPLDAVIHAQSDDPAYVGWGIAFWPSADAVAGTQIGATATSETELAGGPAPVECPLRGIDVPEGATHASVRVAVSSPTGAPIVLTDAYLGTAAGDDPPYPTADPTPFPENRLPNGDFATDVAGWWAFWDAEGIERADDAPLVAPWAMKITTVGSGEEGAIYRDPFGNVVVVPGEPIRLAFRIAGAGTVKAVLDYSDGADAEVWSGVLSGTPTVVAEDVVVPAGTWKVRPYLVTAVEAAVVFWVGDVSLGTPPAEDEADAGVPLAACL